MRIVTLLWTRYGTDDILVRDTEGVLQATALYLDPDGCLVQQHEHRTYEDAAKAARDTTPIRQNRVWSMEATLSKKSCRGEIERLGVRHRSGGRVAFLSCDQAQARSAQ